jgi:hypothetical protein
MKITAEELPSEMRQGKETQEQCGDLTFKTHETSIIWKIHNSDKKTDQIQEEVLHPREEEGEEDHRNLQTIEIHTSTHRRVPETKKNIARIQQEKAMMSIASTMPNQLRPSFWQPQFMNFQPNPVTLQQFQQPQPSWQPSQQFYPQS